MTPIEPTNFNSRLDELYLRCDVSNNMTDDPLSQDEFKAEIKQLFLDVVEQARADGHFTEWNGLDLCDIGQIRTTITGKEGGDE